MEYIVAAGDTLQSIAAMYNISPEKLMRLNNLTANEDLQIGMVLVIEDRKPGKANDWQEELPYCSSCSNNTASSNMAARINIDAAGQPTEEIDPEFSYPGNNDSQTNRPPNRPRPPRPNRPPSQGRPPIQIRPPVSGTIIYPPISGQIQYIEPQLQGLNYAWEESGDFRYILATDRYRYREGQRVNITFRKRNMSNKTVVLRYPSSQLFDFYVSDQKGNELWRWSAMHNFSNIMREIVLSPRQAETINIIWDQRTTYGYWIPAQTLTLWGVNTATNVSIPLEIVIY